MNFITRLEAVLNQLEASGWSIDKEVDTYGSYNHHFEQYPGAQADSPVIRWQATNQDNAGPDIYLCEDARAVYIDYNCGGWFETALSGTFDEITLTDAELLDLLVDVARKSAEALD